jgi:hypothetical protein
VQWTTALYTSIFESSLVATRMRIIILVLIATVTIISIEIALIAVVFHRAVARQFKDVKEAVEGLKEKRNFACPRYVPHHRFEGVAKRCAESCTRSTGRGKPGRGR